MPVFGPGPQPISDTGVYLTRPCQIDAPEGNLVCGMAVHGPSWPFMAALAETRANPEPTMPTRNARIAPATVDRLPRTRSRARSPRQSFRPLFHSADSQWER